MGKYMNISLDGAEIACHAVEEKRLPAAPSAMGGST